MDETAIVSIFFAGFAVIMAYGGGLSGRSARLSRSYLGPLLPPLARNTRTPSSAPERRAQLRLVARRAPEVTRDSEKQYA